MPVPTGRGPWKWIAAAAVLVAASAAFVLNGRGGEPVPGDERAMDEVARLATANHLHDNHLTVQTSDARALEQELSRVLPFAVAVPNHRAL